MILLKIPGIYQSAFASMLDTLVFLQNVRLKMLHLCLFVVIAQLFCLKTDFNF